MGGASAGGATARAAVRHDLPEADDFTRPYWDAAADGRLLLRHCADCGRHHHYPREFCPFCWAGEDRVTWQEASGSATLYTWSVIHRNDLPPFGTRVPYVAAVVDLAEGPRMMTEIVDCAHDDLRIGMPLRVAFREATEDVRVPVFAPEGGGGGEGAGAGGGDGVGRQGGAG
ncbi:Zn-ribbon domain-containing OB-fold protein [Streptomyces sp. NPDC057939]|uniref:Zn-ribbon domain-containing OB-fold protein n=1 Tax=Streptomyces sp. NPDC057939 TaxID=3346284 RepID=UPI0036DFF079